MKLLKNTWKNRTLLLMALPAVLLLIAFCYVPMFGLLLAFKHFDVNLGIWNSPWCGLDNFKYLFLSGSTFWKLTVNTLFYYFLFTVVGTVANVALAIGINEFVFKRLGKTFQTLMILPTFMAYTAVAMIVYAFLQAQGGMMNRWIVALGGTSINWYMEPKYWPYVLTFVSFWKGTGYGSVLYLSVLAGIDGELYEAAVLDGANARQKMWYITIPMLIPMIVIMWLLGLGGMMHSNTGLFYQVTKNTGTIKSTTQVLDSYVLNALLTTSDYGNTTAATFYQSVVGFVMVMVTNGIVRKFAPENALF